MKIYIVDDCLFKDIEPALKREWYLVRIFTTYDNFEKNWDLNADLFIIDVYLDEAGKKDKEGKGWKIIQHIRENKISTPIIVLSGNCETMHERLQGFHLWADDYVSKPISTLELKARIKALLNRPKKLKNTYQICHNNIILDLEKHVVTIENKIIRLNKKEQLLTELFFKNPNRLITRNMMIDFVWWTDDIEKVKDNTINVTLSNLRKKLGNQFSIETRVSQWYILHRT